MDLFSLQVPTHSIHPIFRLLLQDKFSAERDVLSSWAQGFEDRDGKFVKEFQLTFESSLWELYLHAYLKECGCMIDWSHPAPDFVVTAPSSFCVEATIAASAAGGKGAIGFHSSDMPEDFNVFNTEAAIRIANSISAKLSKYRKNYAKLAHVTEKPFVLAIGAYDRPFAHLAVDRPIMAALYGVLWDEEAALAQGAAARFVPRRAISEALKPNGSIVPLGIFQSDVASEISAVVYSAGATWGKIRALSKNDDPNTIIITLHPNPHGLKAEIRHTKKRDYVENLADGLYLFHNPFAKHPLPKEILGHRRIYQMGELGLTGGYNGPDDFLLIRMLMDSRLMP